MGESCDLAGEEVGQAVLCHDVVPANYTHNLDVQNYVGWLILPHDTDRTVTIDFQRFQSCITLRKIFLA